MASLGNGIGSGHGNGNGNGQGSGRLPKGTSPPTALADRLPPQNLEAEQGVLGSILQENDVLHDVVPLLTVDDFYRDAHQVIYRAIRDLYDLGKAVDGITLADELTRRDQLQAVGGVEALAEIQNSVPHAANARYYAEIVRQKSIARQLIESANEILREGYSNNFTAEQLLESAERKVFAIAEDQTKGDTVELKDVMVEAMERIEKRAEERHPITGVASGFFDLDDVIGGFQADQLIILAARPSMGKTALALNICEHAAVDHKIPSLFISLEMGRLELAERLLCSRSRVDGHKLRTGQNMGSNEFLKIGKIFDELRTAPLFIDDTPARNMLQITANARRLKMRADLGMIMVDYIQLIDAEESRDSRQEQIAKISRRLKTLARELHVPVIALSQLNRAVENREDRRPRMADLRECVTGDTLVMMADGSRVPIRDLVGTHPTVLSITPEGRVVRAPSDRVWYVGRKAVFRVSLASGRSIKATALHRLYGLDGWVRVGDLRPGDRLAIARRLPEPADPLRWPQQRLILLAHLIGDGSYLSHQPLRYTTGCEECSSAVGHAAEVEFGCKVTRHEGRGNWHQLVLSGNGNRWHPAGVNRWLRELGIFNQRSHEKRVPAPVFRLSDDQIAVFLKHLWATDGCVWARGNESRGAPAVYFSTASQGLAHDVAALLLRLGIVVRVRTVTAKPLKSPLFHVVVSGRNDQARFLDTVGAFGERRRGADEVRRVLAVTSSNPNVDTLPRAVFDRVRTAMREKKVSLRKMAALRGTLFGGMAHFKFAPSREVVSSYAEILDDDALRGLANSDLFWDTVVSVEPAGEEEVFDLTVPGPASWLADGVVSHNSGAIEQDADIILLLHRPDYYDPNDRPEQAEVIVAKNRNGAVGSAWLRFAKSLTRFENLARVDAPPIDTGAAF